MQTRFETQKLWGWQAAAYLFMAGLGSGSLFVAVVHGFLYQEASVAKLGFLIGPVLLIVGSLFLLLDLGRPILSFLAPRRPRSSWISRGFFILCASILFSLLQMALWVWPWQVMGDFSGAWKVLAIVNGILALFISVYPGLLLGCSSIPLWNTPMLPVLFSVSSLSTGIAALVLAVKWLGFDLFPKGLEFLLFSERMLVILEMILVVLYFYGMKLVAVARESVKSIILGRWAGRFWVGLVGIGLVIPLLTGWIWGDTVVSGVCVLIGGYLLRDIVIRGGVKMPLMAQGMIIPIPGKN